MRRRFLIHTVLLTVLYSLTLLGCGGNDNNPDKNLCRADCGRDLAACVRTCGGNDQTCVPQCLDTFDMCTNDCHDQGGGK
jgi:hypothetical protein